MPITYTPTTWVNGTDHETNAGTSTAITAARLNNLETGVSQVTNTANTLETSVSGKLDTSAAPELIRDTIGTALVAGSNVTITPNDAGDTITIAATGGSTDPEVVRDTIAAALVAGTNVTITPNDGADTITIAASGGGGGSSIGTTGVIKPKVGNWFGPYEAPGSGSYGGTLNRLDLVPIWIAQSTPIDAIAAFVATAAGAGGVVRLGVFNSKSDGMPGTVRFDSGTVATTSTGVKSITISQTLPAGLYYLGAVPQVATAVFRAFGGQPTSRFGWDWDEGYFSASAANAINYLTVSGVSGALADLSSASFGYEDGDVVKVGVKAA